MTSNDKVYLLNPGPVTLTERVRRALLRRDICHREPEFAALQNDVRDRLARVYPEAESDYTAVLITGSGTAAVEAMIDSLVPRAGKALVVANGVYGERVAAILQAHGKQFETVRSEWTEPMNLAETEDRLKRDRELTHVVAVHHETTTGRLNDIAALGALCQKYGVALLLDAVSSFGGEQIDFRGWNVEGCAATANKCLHGVPGISFVLVRNTALADRPSGATTLYLDIFRNYQEQAKGYPLFTPAVHVLYALQEALVEMEEAGGWGARRQRYQALSRILRTGLRRAGLRLLLDDERDYSCVLSSFLLPEGVKFDYLYTQLKEAGFVIYPGQNSLFEAIFRVAVMGDLSPENMEDF
ncbi:MAG TPA: 2-aminoethylphosphonate--pyruvate transaminase, partial [Pyrinomonadaceae bacterium]|nr:2-aminoethylphosphonate--pyruvate transaminase [Pyrinomonadaceae bacterium]